MEEFLKIYKRVFSYVSHFALDLDEGLVHLAARFKKYARIELGS